MRRGNYFDVFPKAGPATFYLYVGPRQRVPFNMTLDRSWRWCILGTMRELRVARGRGRDIAWPNLRRLFARRWADTCRLYDIAEDSAERADLHEMGLTALAEAQARMTRRLREAA